MAIILNLKQPFNSILGARNISVEIDGPSNLGFIIDLLSKKYSPKIKEQLLDNEGALDHSYSIFINGTQARSLLDTIKDGDELLFLTAIGGG